MNSMKSIIRSIGGPIVIFTVFAVALWLLHSELRHYHLKDFVDSLSRIPTLNLFIAIGLTALGYTVLIGYDWMGVQYLDRKLPIGRISLVSLLGFSIGNSFGSLLGGSTVRYRLYSTWGFSAIEIFKLVAFLSLTLWLGILFVGGSLFLIEPLPIPSRLNLPVQTARPLGYILLALFFTYLTLCFARKRPITLRHWEFSLPKPKLALQQIVLASIDMLVTSTILYVLLPPSIETSYWHFVAIYLLASVAAMISHVPGGLGVLELVLIVLLNPKEPQALVGSLLAFRVIYFLLPLALGLIGLAVTEFMSNRGKAGNTAHALGRLSAILAPKMLTITVFLAGVILLLSGATPSIDARLATLRKFLPLPIIEISHFAGSVIGMLLLILARGLQRRIETAYYLTLTLLGGGIILSLLKGFDYEEAILLSLMFLIMLPARKEFYRRGALFTDRFSARWLLAVAVVLASAYWLMMMSYKQVNYQNELWWEFAFDKNAPRSLRALFGVTIILFFFCVIRLLRSKSEIPSIGTSEDIKTATPIIAKSPRADSNLARLGDKRFLFDDQNSAFIMYGVEGQSWVAMGDPIGDEQAGRELAWRFRDMCDEGGWWPVFYQVNESSVPMYIEMGMSVIKIGEEALVPLKDFSLEGHSRRNLRRSYKKLTEQGCTFEIIEPPAVDALLPRLREISDTWLSEKNAAEKGFSLGFFQEDYVRDCPIAAVKSDGQIVAFANMWLGANHQEMTIDLMRYVSDAPSGVMDYLFAQLMLWGKEQGFEGFSLGMAPLSGIEAQQNGTAWNQIAALTYEHGEHFYNFQGLRHYKAKFEPEWSPKYIASPGGWTLPVMLTNVAALISGGVIGLVKK